jgi:hypothetical protein
VLKTSELAKVVVVSPTVIFTFIGSLSSTAKVLKVVKSWLVFWVVIPCGLVVGGYQCFSLEDGGSMFLWITSIYLQVHTALLLKRPTLTSSPP